MHVIKPMMAVVLFMGTAVVTIPSRPPDAQEVTCDRACLEGFIDLYLGAMTAHDPGRLPLTDDAVFTENGQVLELGDGMWGPETRLGDYSLYFTDPVTGQAGCYAVVYENGHPQILALRLKIERRRISEIETLVARSTEDSFGEPEALADVPVFRQPLPAVERRSRRELVAIADSYFEGLEKNTAGLTPFEDGCTRIENGIVTANNPDSDGMQRMTCREQFETGFSTFITRIRECRYPIVDEDRGLVFAMVFFDHAGTVKTVELSNGTEMTVPPPYDTPYTWMIGELFKIADGKISYIKAVLLPVPYGMPSGWRQ